MAVIEVDRAGEVWQARWEAGRANALSPEVVADLHRLLDDAAHAGVGALVLRGGRRYFGSGVDLSGMDAETDASLALRFLRIGTLLDRLRSAPFLTVAVATGAAIGAAADLFAACDRRLALTSVEVAFPGSRFGVVLGTDRLTALVGPSNALGLVGGARASASVIAAVHDAEDLLEADLEDLLAGWTRTHPSARLGLLSASRAAGASGGAFDGDRGLAALARSIARPGLRDRMHGYTQSLKEHA